MCNTLPVHCLLFISLLIHTSIVFRLSFIPDVISIFAVGGNRYEVVRLAIEPTKDFLEARKIASSLRTRGFLPIPLLSCMSRKYTMYHTCAAHLQMSPKIAMRNQRNQRVYLGRLASESVVASTLSTAPQSLCPTTLKLLTLSCILRPFRNFYPLP